MSRFFSHLGSTGRRVLPYVHRWIHLSDLYEWSVRLIAAVHRSFMLLLIGVAQLLPLIGLLIEGVGFLCSPLKAFFDPSRPTTNTVSLGLKVTAGLAMTTCAIAGIVFPPLGFSMVLVGLSAAIPVHIYKMYRTSHKITQLDRDPENTQLNHTADYYHHKLKQRGSRLALSLVNLALLSITILLPPTAVFTLSALLAINFAYAVHENYQQHQRTQKPLHADHHRAPSQPPSDDELEWSMDEVEESHQAPPIVELGDDAGLPVVTREISVSQPQPLVPTSYSWSSQTVFVVSALYGLAGFFDIAMVMCVVFFATSRLLKPVVNHSQDNQPLALEDLTQDKQETPAPQEEHCACNSNQVSEFLNTMTHQVIPEHAATYVASH